MWLLHVLAENRLAQTESFLPPQLNAGEKTLVECCTLSFVTTIAMLIGYCLVLVDKQAVYSKDLTAHSTPSSISSITISSLYFPLSLCLFLSYSPSES